MAGNEEKNYIDELADEIGERCDVENERMLRMYALVGLIQGTDVTLEAVYNAWAVWRASTGLDNSKIKPIDTRPDTLVPKDAEALGKIQSAIIAAVESKLHREARAKSSSRSPEQARPGD